MPSPFDHHCDAGDLVGYESPQIGPVRCDVCRRCWWPNIVKGKIVGWTVSAVPRGLARTVVVGR